MLPLSSTGMLTTIVTLPDDDATARERALVALRGWLTQWQRDVRDRFVLNQRHVMIVASEAAVADLPQLLDRHQHPRTTRWALLADLCDRQFEVAGEIVHGSRHFLPGGTLVVYPPEPRAAKVRVLGPRRGGDDLTIVSLPIKRLEHWRVGKLDHPAMLWMLERDAEYWPATGDAKETAVKHVADLEVRARAARGEA